MFFGSMAVAPSNPLRRSTRLTARGDIRIDDYDWMRDRADAAVIAHLNAENGYTATVTRHIETLHELLF